MFDAERRAQLEEALLAAQTQLIEQEPMAALGALVAGVAHDVNTPVGVALTAASSMGSYADQMLALLGGEKVSRSELSALSGKLKEAAQLVERNLARAAELIGNFKQLAVDQGSDYMAELALREYVAGVVLAHSPELNRAALRVELDIDAACKVCLPAGKTGQILSNLLMNSVRHGYPDGGPGVIRIAAGSQTGAAGEWLLLEFADDGVGLAPEVRARLFEPFFTTTRGQGGSGLGMHIIHTIVQQLGGEVWAVESPGCRIRMRLPLVCQA
ncbi:his Kinase A domain protein [Janthinobacterium agaricidamnosum NBRC 102515 = DSM 9628]|uniref:histidine kinase n=1 Tax=Janthinobacterium agaricidamnosum NBRC 102515 = DSM 9628 TaxID=1349767 RepID=W0VBH4_9BURK|nr:his Kinase A domain protein [Janthinobacterium agaricidamnosum NBRC 102515 = DSM 9628]